MFPHSVPGRFVTAWREARFDLVLCLEQLTEIGRVLAYPKIRKVLQWDDETIERFLKQLYLRGGSLIGRTMSTNRETPTTLLS